MHELSDVINCASPSIAAASGLMTFDLSLQCNCSNNSSCVIGWRKITWYDAISGKRDVCACPFACNVVLDSCMDEFHKSCDITLQYPWKHFPIMQRWIHPRKHFPIMQRWIHWIELLIGCHISVWCDGAFRSTLFVHSIYRDNRLLGNQKHKHGTIRPINSPGFSMSRSLEEALYYWDGCLILNCKGTGNHGNQMAIVICDLLNKTYHIVIMVTWVRMVCECYF